MQCDYSDQSWKLLEQIAPARFCRLHQLASADRPPSHQFEYILVDSRPAKEQRLEALSCEPHGALIATRSGIKRQPAHKCAQAQLAAGFSGRNRAVHTGTADLADRTICFFASLWQRSVEIAATQASKPHQARNRKSIRRFDCSYQFPDLSIPSEFHTLRVCDADSSRNPALPHPATHTHTHAGPTR